MTGSGQARGAGTTLRRLVVRFALLVGFTAAGWLASVLLTSGTASADLIELPRIPGITAPQSQQAQAQHQKPAKAPAKKKTGKSGGGDLVGGLLSQVTSTVDDTLGTVTTTVTTTLDTVTKTVVTTVDGVTKTVTTVVDQVAQIPGALLPPPQSGDDDHDGGLLPDPIGDLLKPQPKTPSPNKDTDAADRGTATVETPAAAIAAVAAPADVPVVEAPVTEHPRLLQEARRTSQLTIVPAPVKSAAAAHMVAPADNSPRPLPGPPAPVAPAAPAPTASAGGNSGSDARSILAVLTPRTTLAAPQAGLLHWDEAFAEVSRSAGLPATPPD
ncbi:hypothetical protein [Kibdelosporangium phytohabitans]|uniref:hypothetical protein n=1 Tax=Kibdelosporangium phytohabitans TaxID=860235 RepID=UPI0012FA1C24|nr:hypothetical protein [Kibdelosporangium phytohabitans]MBE1466965.1 hypothetical protein [Kibdelosporangium phytohabitans]